MAGGAVGTLAVLLSGCTGDDGDPAALEAERASAAQRLRSQEAHRSETLLTEYEATLQAHPDLAERLNPLRRTVERHAEALGGGSRPPQGGRPAEVSGSPSAVGSPHPAGSPAVDGPTGDPAAEAARKRVPQEPDQALAALAEAERRATDARTTALVTAPPELARLLASVAAAGAAHAYLLRADG